MKQNSDASSFDESDIFVPEGTTYNLFPTPIKFFELAEQDMNTDLAAFFTSHPRFRRRDQAEMSDVTTLMEHANEAPALTRLESLFLACLKNYCREIGWQGEFDLAMQMFPNVAPKGHYVPSHNHVSHISAVYYVQTRVSDKPLIVNDESTQDYWRPDEGALILHDPRFNASLLGGWQYHTKVFPRPGVMIFFPSFLWHEVTPHKADEPRLSVAANFTLTYRNVPRI
ncbi:MAG: putative 2OG-Fe(II) oxygenase [Porticoccaceae bacterium]